MSYNKLLKMNDPNDKTAKSSDKGMTIPTMQSGQNEKLTISDKQTQQEDSPEEIIGEYNKFRVDDLENKIRENGSLVNSNVSTKKAPKMTCWKRILNFLFAPIQTGSRMVFLNGRCDPANYVNNIVRNQKYNFITFQPVFFYNQFKFFFNMFFLLITVTQFFKPLQIGFMVTYVGPLGIVIFLSQLKEVYDEFTRAMSDYEYNSEKFTVLTKTGEKVATSGSLKVGQMVKLVKDKRIPADMQLLWTSDPQEIVYLKTDQLDGETDWKLKEPVKYTQNILQQDKLKLLQQTSTCSVTCTEPSNAIYEFSGTFFKESDSEDFEVLRLKNTMWANTVIASGEAIGLVLYTGKETRIQMGIKRPQTKFGKIDYEINFQSKLLFSFSFTMSVVLQVLSGINIESNWHIQFIRYILLQSSIIPISLRVNIDFAKLVYSARINKDKDIEGTIVRNTSIPEELGRIEHLLCDKTGTLTQNYMIFKQICCMMGNFSEDTEADLKRYIEMNIDKSATTCSEWPLSDGKKKDRMSVFRDFLTAIMVCHNVTPTFDSGVRNLKASSPDEIALVKYGEHLGYYLANRSNRLIEIVNIKGISEKYEILYNFPFTSERRRMGIVVRDLNSRKIIFFLKGADSVIKERVGPLDCNFIEEECENLAKEGLRTQAFTQKVLTEEEFETWDKKMKDAGKDYKYREEKEEETIENLESKMIFQGMTGVEDLLQEKIKEVIESLKSAGIKLWMLTGDKLETAKCIAIATGLKKTNEKFFELSDFTDIKQFKIKLDEFERYPNDVIIIEGSTLAKVVSTTGNYANADARNIEERFLKVASLAPCVVCCRCSPNQKEAITKGMKLLLGRGIAGIGDGGNDVGMIQSANVGIGIEGKEGKQAALASDFSIQKFMDVKKLLLWHGRLSYIRTALLTNFIIHRGLIISVIQLQFTLTFHYVSIQIYNGYLMLGYATIFTSLPIFALIYVEDVPKFQAQEYPILYKQLQNGREISLKRFLMWTWKSIYQASVIMLCSLRFFDSSFQEIVTITFTSLIIIEMINVLFEIRNYHIAIVASLVCSFIIYMICLFGLRELFLLSEISGETFIKVVGICFLCTFPFKCYTFIQVRMFPSTHDKIRKEAIEKAKRKDNKNYDPDEN